MHFSKWMRMWNSGSAPASLLCPNQEQDALQASALLQLQADSLHPDSRTKSTLWPVRLKDPGTLCLPTCLLPGLPHTPLPKDPLQPFSSWPPVAYGLPGPLCLPVLVWETIVVTCRSDPVFLPVSSKELEQNLRGSGLHNWIRIMGNRERIQSRAKKECNFFGMDCLMASAIDWAPTRGLPARTHTSTRQDNPFYRWGNWGHMSYVPCQSHMTCKDSNAGVSVAM